jgi:hypothetical protein
MRASAQSFVEYECNAVRAETPLAGSVLPVEVERDDPTQGNTSPSPDPRVTAAP